MDYFHRDHNEVVGSVQPSIFLARASKISISEITSTKKWVICLGLKPVGWIENIQKDEQGQEVEKEKTRKKSKV